MEYSTFVLKSAFCSDEVILWLRLTGMAWSIALHLLTVTQLVGSQGALTVCALQASIPPNPETGEVH